MRSLVAVASLVLILAFGLLRHGPAGSCAQRIDRRVPAESKDGRQGKAESAHASPGACGAAPRPQVVMPDAEKIVLLVRTTLLTLNDALRTGNYTVLRDKGAPGFRDANSAARLGQIFSSLAASGLDLSVVAVMTPQLSEAPVLDQAQGTLNLKGYFPTKPTQIDFEVLYQSVGGHWQVFGLSVQPAKAPEAPPQVGSTQDDSGTDRK